MKAKNITLNENNQFVCKYCNELNTASDLGVKCLKNGGIFISQCKGIKCPMDYNIRLAKSN